MHCRGEYNSLDLLSFPETFSSNLGDSQSIRKEGDLSSGTRVNHRWLEFLPQPPSGTEWRRRKRFTRKEKGKESPEKKYDFDPCWSRKERRRASFSKSDGTLTWEREGNKRKPGQVDQGGGGCYSYVLGLMRFLFRSLLVKFEIQQRSSPYRRMKFSRDWSTDFLRQFKFKSERW